MRVYVRLVRKSVHVVAIHCTMAQHAVIDRKNESAVRKVDATVKNKWNWSRIEKEFSTDIKNLLPEVNWKRGAIVNHFGDFIRKVDQPGLAICIWCNNAIINYGGRGFLALSDHAKGKKHVTQLHTRYTNEALPGTSTGSQRPLYGLPAMFATQKKNLQRSDESTVPSPSVHISDRVVHQEALVLSVLAENSLPFSMGPVVVDTARELAKDPQALSKVGLSRTTCSYKMRFGLAKTFNENTITTIQQTPFSLNIDESFSTNHKKVLTTLVSYYSSDKGEVVVEHFDSSALTTVNSASLYQRICSLFEDNSVPWTNLMSVLMDSCAVMRGSKSGLEQRLRTNKAPHLLDIDGDSCHHLHNAAKHFCQPFEGFTESLFKDIYNDHKFSTDLRASLSEICEMLSLKFTVPDVYINWRWLSCYDVSVGTLRMMDAYVVFYYSFLNKEDKKLYKSSLTAIFEKLKVSPEAVEAVKKVQSLLEKKSLTEDGKARKKRICEKLYYKSNATKLALSFYAFGLETLKSFVCLFQSKEPLIHKLHDRQIEVFRELMSYFVKPEKMAKASVSDLLKLDLSQNENLLKPEDMLFGPQVAKIVTSLGKNHFAVKDFFGKAKMAYIKCMVYLQKKLPLTSKVLQSLSALDPLARGHSIALKKLKNLPGLMPTVLTSNEKERFDKEVHLFQNDTALPSYLNDKQKEVRCDHWWSLVAAGGKYPCLSKIAFAAMSCFHGAQVESSFSAMNDIIDAKSGNIRTETYSALQTVKFKLKSSNKSALEYFERKDDKEPVDILLVHNMTYAKKAYEGEKQEGQKKSAEAETRLNLNVAQLKESKTKSKQQLVAGNKRAREEFKKKKTSGSLPKSKKRRH